MRNTDIENHRPEKDVRSANNKLNRILPQKCTVSSQESQRLQGRRGGGWSGGQEEAISNPVMSFIFREYRWKHHETTETVEEMCGNGEESGDSEEEADKRPLASTSAEAVSGFEDVRYFCFYKINNLNLWRLGTFGETARLSSTFGGRERAAGHLSHATNKADVTPLLLQKSNIPGTHACSSHVFIFYSVVFDFLNVVIFCSTNRLSSFQISWQDNGHAKGLVQWNHNCSYFFSFFLCPLKNSTKI